MKRSMAFLLLLAGFVRGAEKELRFEDFPATKVFRGKVAKPRMVNWYQRNYRSTILGAAEEGVDFAGSLIVAEAGCGTDCIVGFIIDPRTGVISQPPFSLPRRTYYDGGVLDYRADSRLMRVYWNCFLGSEPPFCDVYNYEWTGRKFRFMSMEKRTGL